MNLKMYYFRKKKNLKVYYVVRLVPFFARDCTIYVDLTVLIMFIIRSLLATLDYCGINHLQFLSYSLTNLTKHVHQFESSPTLLTKMLFLFDNNLAGICRQERNMHTQII